MNRPLRIIMEMPKRLQRKRTKGWKLPANAVYVGRPTKWGNPFKLGEKVPVESPLFPYLNGFDSPIRGFTSLAILAPEKLIEAYTRLLIETPRLMLAINNELAGKDLACWCRLDRLCHADVLLGLANDRET